MNVNMAMITINSLIGNVSTNEALKEKYDQMSRKQLLELIKISRLESERTRMRKTSDRGTDIAITLPSGSKLRHGDVVILNDDKMVVLEIQPEDVVMIQVKNNLDQNHAIEIPVRIGHTIGNLHRPIKLERNMIYFPIQADTELEMFKKLFAPINDHLEIQKTTMVFEPEEGTEIHEH